MNTSREISGVWRLAQAVSVMSALAVVALLVVRPEWGLFITWSVLIPVVPALLLIAPQVWRSLCPIAVVHQLPRAFGRGGRRRLSNRSQWWAPAVAAAGLFVIVPARHPVFNEYGGALALFVVIVLIAALIGGALYAGKSGWCSTYCPVGPVERLYGQAPVLEPQHAHCASCVGCTDPCFDRDGAFAVMSRVGEAVDGSTGDSRRKARLFASPIGAFVAAFPGFVLGYFTVSPDAGIGSIYLHVVLLAAASFALFVGGQFVFRFSARNGIRVAAAAAAGLYYWFTVPAIIAATEATWGMGPAAGWVDALGRGLLLLVVGLWFLDAPRRSRRLLQKEVLSYR